MLPDAMPVMMHLRGVRRERHDIYTSTKDFLFAVNFILRHLDRKICNR